MLDQIQDANESGLYQLHNVVEFPEFVKEASKLTAEEASELPPAAFAMPTHRMYPVHTRADTWLSSAYFQKFGSDMPAYQRQQVEACLKAACELWKIAMPTWEEKKPIEKVAWTVEYPDPCKHICPVSSGEELQKVAADVLEPSKYPFAVRQAVARSVLAAPDELRASFSPELEASLCKVACYGIGCVDDARSAIHLRLLATEKQWPAISEGLKEASAMLDKTADDSGLVSGELMGKLAALLDAVDRFAGLHSCYSSGFQPPERQLFSMTLRDFDDFSKHAVRLPGGQYVSKAQLGSKDVLSFLENSFGQKCASAEEALKVVSELPERKARILVDYIRHTEQA